VELNLGSVSGAVVRDEATDLRLAEAGLSGESNLTKGSFTLGLTLTIHASVRSSSTSCCTTSSA
jgi:hypothetical protein